MDELKVGRELDALIAEKVFGWAWKLDEDTYSGGKTSGLYRVICDPALWGDEYPLLGLASGNEPARLERPYNGQSPLHYSTDIAAAWLVAEHTRKTRGWRWQVNLRDEDAFAAAYFQTQALGVAFNEHAPLAICLAALQALEVSSSLAST